MKRASYAFLIAASAAACTASTEPSALAAPGGVEKVRSASSVVGPPAGGLCPETVIRQKGTPVVESFVFDGAEGQSANMVVTDNGIQGLNGTIELNGETIVNQSMLGGNGPVNLSIPVVLGASNTLKVRLTGKPGSGLTICIS